MSLVVSQKVCSCDHKAITHNYPIKNKRNTAVLQLKRLVLASQGWVNAGQVLLRLAPVQCPNENKTASPIARSAAGRISKSPDLANVRFGSEAAARTTIVFCE
jgi:hypothetical protein